MRLPRNLSEHGHALPTTARALVESSDVRNPRCIYHPTRLAAMRRVLRVQFMELMLQLRSLWLRGVVVPRLRWLAYFSVLEGPLLPRPLVSRPRSPTPASESTLALISQCGVRQGKPCSVVICVHDATCVEAPFVSSPLGAWMLHKHST